MPLPVSFTLTVTKSPSEREDKVIVPPSKLNFMALEIKLRIIVLSISISTKPTSSLSRFSRIIFTPFCASFCPASRFWRACGRFYCCCGQGNFSPPPCFPSIRLSYIHYNPNVAQTQTNFLFIWNFMFAFFLATMYNISGTARSEKDLAF